MESFRLAVAQGAEGIELDVQRTADGVLVVCHDERVTRTSNGKGRIEKQTYDELAALDFSYLNPELGRVVIPTLDEVLDLVRATGVTLNIELKNSVVRYKGMEADVVAAVRNAGVEDQVLYSSFNHRSVRKLADKGLSTGVLFGEVLADPEIYAKSLGAVALHPGVSVVRLDKRLVERAHQAGLRVHVWTVDQPKQLDRMFALDVDAVMTNRPARALARRTEFGAR